MLQYPMFTLKETKMSISEEKKLQITESRRKQILDAAIRLFDMRGYSNTRIIDIANAAGISKGLVYHYFDSKESILTALIGHLKKCIAECASISDPEEGMRLFANRLLSYPYYEDYVPPIRVFYTAILHGEVDIDPSIYPIHDDFGKTYFGELFKRGQEKGIFRAGDPEVFGDIFWKYLIGNMSMMSVNKEGHTYIPDIDPVLALFKPEHHISSPA